MKTWIVTGVVGAVLALTVLFSGAASAQRPAGGPDGGPQGGPESQFDGQGRPPMGMMRGPQGGPPHGMRGPRGPQAQAGATGLYLMHGGTLVKFDTSARQVGEVTIIEDTAPEMDAETPGRRGGRRMPGGPCDLQVVDGTDTVLVAASDTLVKVDGTTMKVVGRVTLPEVTMPEPPQGVDEERPAQGDVQGTAPRSGRRDGRGQRMGSQRGPGMGMPPSPPAVLELEGNTLYVLRGPSLVTVNISSMTVIGESTLPMPEGRARR